MNVFINKQFIEEISSIDNQVTELYEKKKKKLDELFRNNPMETEIKFCCENLDGSWTRLTVTDNLETIREGFWKTVRVERFSTKTETLKNKPKELKDEE